jgi:hypothetical protein
MPLLRQLEFAFRTVSASLWEAPRVADRSSYKTLILKQKLASCCVHSARLESRTSFASNGIRVLKLPLVALIIARNSFR